MLRLLDDPELQRAQSNKARERALEFLPARFVEQYVALLEEVVAHR